ncbi:MAG: T9SS type A sorting domain-containing protein [Melioribacteraceae bacterium]|nr:T9SS type A sorting domain-containing protein [Melioribacteraceae bacterium]MCF8265880.1 T9SS type A sorting domain-containing protein [Melioribacteraceae bacterium]MCF8413429.1 T9SS type A sorting domain-containing protein [Melioribacteraceae bacterium]
MKKLNFIFLVLIFALTYYTINKAQTKINFSGIEWIVKNGTGGPGPNNWSNDSKSVWVDSTGALHLKIRKEGNKWYCAEVYAQQSFGYGEYRFYVSSDLENYNQNIVVGLFLYENDSREIDIEFSKWGNNSNKSGWYTIQPPPYSNSQKNFELNLTGLNSTHSFNWSANNIIFQSYQGHFASLPSSNYLIERWNYTGDKNPPLGKERLHINFWLFGGNPPSNQEEAELIINAVFIPTGSIQINLSPKEAIDAGAMWKIDSGVWQSSGTVMDNLISGNYIIDFKTIDGWSSPPGKFVSLSSNQTIIDNGVYTSVVDVDFEKDRIFKYSLEQNYPNPFNPVTTIKYELEQTDYITIKVYDAVGTEIETLETGIKTAGSHQIRFDAADYPTGVYFYQIYGSNFTDTKKAILIK